MIYNLDDDVVRSLLKSRFITLEAHREKIIKWDTKMKLICKQ
jgi:hypothetical protein